MEKEKGFVYLVQLRLENEKKEMTGTKLSTSENKI